MYRLAALVLLTLVVAGRLGALLWTRRRDFAEADNILVYWAGGFAHSLIGTDMMRRLYPGQRNVTVFFLYVRNHNTVVDRIWGERDKLLWLDTAIPLPYLGLFESIPLRKGCSDILRAMLKWARPAANVLGTDSLFAMPTIPADIGDTHFRRTRLEARFYPLIKTRPAPNVRLPEEDRRRVKAALPADEARWPLICNLYLRNKGHAADPDPTSRTRCSVALADHLPAVRSLNQRGFQVLITGDVELDESLRQEFGPALLDWRSLPGIPKSLYQVYAATECHCHVGNLSGGSAFTYCTDIPSLMINAFSFGEALPFATVHYKYLVDADGLLVPPDRLFADFTFDYRCDGYRVLENTAEQIREAVDEFIDNLGVRPFGVTPEAAGLTDQGWFSTCDARISPVWLSRFSTQTRWWT